MKGKNMKIWKTKCATMKDWEFLNWVRDRLVSKYGESAHVDYIYRLEQIRDQIRELESNDSQKSN